MFPLNCWYVAASSEELIHKPLGRTVCNKDLVFYRLDSGQAIALEDFCPHRGLPLSLGYVQGDNLVCGYHGLEVDCLGNCAGMLSQGERAQRFRPVTTYPLAEKGGYIWVWLGEKEKADEDLVPKMLWAETESWVYAGSYYHMNCDYRLLIDNLMDLTHETYVHSSSIGQPEIDEAEPELEVLENEVVLGRNMQNLMPPPFWREALKGNGAAHDVACDRWQICHFLPPSQVMIEVGVAHAGTGGKDADEKHRASGVVVDFITPESEHSCHYFWGMARNFNIHSNRLSTQMLEAQGRVFEEDRVVLEQQQANLLKHPDRRLMTLNIDSGGRHARNMIDKMISAEASTG